MRLELVVLFVVAFVAVIGLMQAEFSGMAVADSALAHYPSIFGLDFNALIIKGKMRSPEEITAANLIISRLPEQYALIQQALHAKGIMQESLLPQYFQDKIVTDDQVDYRATDAILVGSLCHNSAIAHLLGVIDCVSYFKPGEGMVKYIESSGHKYVIFTGYGGDEVLSSVLFFLSELQLGKINSNELRIDSSTKVPLRDPRWFGEYTTTPSYRDTMKNKVFVLGEWMDLR
ncbi:hypothetical protein KY338_06800 [Candidatus Woesearchaeota archaeon]|nr:hypothetical protein [Candidatus Woesearchaeota archaeon]MBW3006387.1 hypothetical protein [Candidatus Woesearchaeota archaeon]